VGASEGRVGNSISVILFLLGCVVVFTSELLWLSIAGALLMAVGLWRLDR
jgi:hypothetical protein